MAASEPVRELHIIPIPFPEEIQSGDWLSEKLISALKHHKLTLKKGDIMIVKHKIVSKAEGQFVQLDKVKPSLKSRAW
jgi:coenzyme F420-0:L-glutamate ligase/coenzyme F420-1:gamma-L-glutamate ligase